MQWDDWPPRERALLPGFEAWRDGRHGVARELFETHLASDPHSADAWRGLGNVHWSAGAFAESARCYRRCIEIDPCNPMHWGNLGLALRDLRDTEGAIAVFRVSLGLDPTYAPGLNEWANVLFDAGRLVEALQLYDRSLAIDGGRAVVHHNKGVCLRYSGRLPEAVACFARALEIDPGYGYALEELRRLGVAREGEGRTV